MIEMTALPNVSATETADLRDVHTRLRDCVTICQILHIGISGFYRFENWRETKIYPRFF